MKKRPKGRVQFVLDEFAAVGHLECIDQALGIGRGYAIRLIFVLQQLAQARKNFPDGQEQTLLGNTSQIYFGVNDQQTADMVSARLGEQTITVSSGGKNRGWQRSFTRGAQKHQDGGNTSGGSSENWSLTPRKLLKPEEVMALPRDIAVTFTPGAPPICTKLVKYYQEPGLFKRKGWLRRQWQGFKTLLAATLICAVTVMVAAALVSISNQTTRRLVPVQYQGVGHEQGRWQSVGRDSQHGLGSDQDDWAGSGGDGEWGR